MNMTFNFFFNYYSLHVTIDTLQDLCIIYIDNVPKIYLSIENFFSSNLLTQTSIFSPNFSYRGNIDNLLYFSKSELRFTGSVSYLRSFYEYSDILEIIGRRPNIYQNPIYIFVYTHCNTHILLGFFIIISRYLIETIIFSFKHILDLINNFLVFIKRFSNKILFLIKKSNFAKYYSNYTNNIKPLFLTSKVEFRKNCKNYLDQFLNNLVFRNIPDHLRNLQVYMNNGNLPVEPNSVLIRRLFRSRENTTRLLRQSSGRLSVRLTAFMEYLDSHGITLSRNNGALEIELPLNSTINRVDAGNHIESSIRLINQQVHTTYRHFGALNHINVELSRLGVNRPPTIPPTYSSALALLNTYHSRFGR